MIQVWIYTLIGLFVTCITYFVMTEPVMSLLNTFQTYGAAEWFIADVSRAYHFGFIILCVGIILYGLIYSTKTEPDTYRI